MELDRRVAAKQQKNANQVGKSTNPKIAREVFSSGTKQSKVSRIAETRIYNIAAKLPELSIANLRLSILVMPKIFNTIKATTEIKAKPKIIKLIFIHLFIVYFMKILKSC